MYKFSWIKKWKGRDIRGARRGFTLVELIVTLCLIAMLSAVSVGGILAYQDYANYRKNNESARTVFNAAQSALAFYRSSGRLEGLERRMSDLNQMVPATASDDAKGNRLSYLMLKKSTGAGIAEQSKNGSASKEEALLYELLRDYITDTSVYNAAICIEFDAADGVVSAVFYSDRAEKFSYTGESGALAIGQKAERTQEECKKKNIGYYDTELSKRAPSDLTKPVFSYVRLENDETLDLAWGFKGSYKNRAVEFSYAIDLFEGDSKEPKVRLEIPVDADGSLGISKEEGGSAFVKNVKVTLFGESEAEKLVSDPKRWQFHAYLTDDGIRLSLDVVDLGSIGKQTAAESEEAWRSLAIADTYSAQRLSCTVNGKHYGLDLNAEQNISASIQAEMTKSGTSLSTYTVTSENRENLLFATRESTAAGGGQTENPKIYEIANARHLYNARFREEENTAALAITYQIIRDFGWGGEAENCLLSHQTNRAGFAAGEKTSFTKCFANMADIEMDGAQMSSAVYPGFPTIKTLHANSILTGTAAKNEAAEGNAGTEDGTQTGAAQQEDWRTLSGFAMDPEQEDGSYQENLGLVCTNEGTIQKLRLADVQVRGTKIGESGVQSVGNVGAVCGENKGTITDVEVVSGTVTGSETVGGIVGNHASKQSISGWKNGASVTGFRFVGGIVGSAELFSISDCTNTGLVTGREALTDAEKQKADLTGANVGESLYIGGITGFANGADGGNAAVISNCVSAPTPKKRQDALWVEDEDWAADEEQVLAAMQGSYVGGIVGYLTGQAGLEGCSVQGGYVLGKYAVGGIVGAQYGEGSVLASLETQGGNPAEAAGGNQADVIGRRFVGGIVGIQGSIQADPEKTDLKSLRHENIISAKADQQKLTGWTNGGRVLAVPFGGGTDDQTLDAAYVGGIAGVNAGAIYECTVHTEESAAQTLPENLLRRAETADFVGGIAGANTGSGRIGRQTDDPLAWQIKVSVTGRNFVGGVTGYQSMDAAASSILLADGSAVEGQKCVGGIAGATQGMLDHCETAANVSVAAKGDGGSAGGIAGEMIAQPDRLTAHWELKNLASVTSEQGDAGGITALLGASVSILGTCESDGNITAVQGNAGGIAGVNESEIGTEKENQQSVVHVQGEIRGGKNTGGIAGRNLGTIRGVSMTLGSTNVVASGGNIGGIVGSNEGSIEDIWPENEHTASEEAALAYRNRLGDSYTVRIGNDGNSSSDAKIGGIAGRNSSAGAVRRAQTSDRWLVSAQASDGEIYAGGCIGYLETAMLEETTEYQSTVSGLVNYADVAGAKGCAAVGGVIGRLHAGKIAEFTLANCKNYGVVDTTAANLDSDGAPKEDGTYSGTQTAGILASVGIDRIKTEGNENKPTQLPGDIITEEPEDETDGDGTDGETDGDVTDGTTDGNDDGTGGEEIVDAGETPSDSGTVNLYGCRNFGTIRGVLSAGILGSVDTIVSNTRVLLVQNSVNLGDIASGAGIYLSMDDTELASSSAEVRLVSCRNYAPGSEHFAGIYGMGHYEAANEKRGRLGWLDFAQPSVQKISIRGCIGMQTADGQTAIAPASVQTAASGDELTKNYYLKDARIPETEAPERSIGTGYAFAENNETLDQEFPNFTLTKLLEEKAGNVIQKSGDAWDLTETLAWTAEKKNRVPFALAADEILQSWGKEAAVPAASEPVLSSAYQLSDDDMATFSWTSGDETAEETAGVSFYNVTLYGVEEGAEEEKTDGVLLESAQGLQGTELTVDASEWTSEQVRLEVTKVESLSVDGSLVYREATAEATYQCKTVLSQPRAPQIERTAKTENTAAEDDMCYLVSWEQQTEGCRGYWLMAVTGDDETICLAEITDEAQTETVLDFEELGFAGQTVDLYVRALADTSVLDENGDPIYQDSPEGVRADLAVPVRLQQPVIAENAFSLAEDAEQGVEQEAYADLGLELLLGTKTEQTGSYLICAGIYDTPELTDGVPAGNLLSDGTMYDDQTQLFAQGDLQSSSYTFDGLVPEYAGKYLLVRARAVGEQAIDSPWSSYAAYRLPKARLAAPVLTAELLTKRWEKKRQNTDPATGEITYEDVTLSQAALFWELAEEEQYQVDVFALDMFAAQETPSEEETFSLRVGGTAENGFYMERELTEKEKTKFRKEHPGEELPKKMVYSLEADSELRKDEYDEKRIRNVYTLELNEAALGDEIYQYSYGGFYAGTTYLLEDICAELRVVEEKEGRCRMYLILPDVEEPYAEYQKHIVTQAVEVTALPAADEEEKALSAPSEWIRIYHKDTLQDYGQFWLSDYFRTVVPSEDGELHYAMDYEKDEFADEAWAILPRNFGELHPVGMDAAAEAAETLSAEAAGATAPEDGTLILEDEMTEAESSSGTDTFPETETESVTEYETEAAQEEAGFEDVSPEGVESAMLEAYSETPQSETAGEVGLVGLDLVMGGSSHV